MYMSFSGLPEVKGLSARSRTALYKQLSSELNLGRKFAILLLLAAFCGVMALGALAKLGYVGDVLSALGLAVMFVVWMFGHTLILNRIIHPALKVHLRQTNTKISTVR